ncbi:hypothetical protein GQ43DRAFT_289569 [Delitschia confertaspora ATCC 74209]|uniref:Transmembrane protein n=1 Tax=Delitschia confertaspora ATCC 74209 TaxID=1513339 RepID=A0A9P4JPH4_9PLEO|nr:hypothetical protein GQ43DRAFT_289569 [Delitschia confertaspora ATCC 74209]
MQNTSQSNRGVCAQLEPSMTRQQRSLQARGELQRTWRSSICLKVRRKADDERNAPQVFPHGRSALSLFHHTFSLVASLCAYFLVFIPPGRYSSRTEYSPSSYNLKTIPLNK